MFRLAKFDSDKTKIQGFRENLKSTGQSKFTLEEKEETGVRSHLLGYCTVYQFINIAGLPAV